MVCHFVIDSGILDRVTLLSYPNFVGCREVYLVLVLFWFKYAEEQGVQIWMNGMQNSRSFLGKQLRVQLLKIGCERMNTFLAIY